MVKAGNHDKGEEQGGFDPQIDRLLQDPKVRNNPLLPVVKSLYQETREQRARLDKLVRIADGFDNLMVDENKSITARYDRHLKRLEKIARISDLYQKDLMELNDKLHHASRHDPLTDLPNRRFISARLKELVSLARRKGAGFALILLDMDHFKAINDNYGHETGDKVLCRVAETLEETLRGCDTAGRWGGEEFLVILPETTTEQALEVAHRLKDRVRRIRLPEPCVSHKSGSQTLSLSASLGVSAYRPGESYDETLRRTDDAMYQSKAKGRNRVEQF